MVAWLLARVRHLGEKSPLLQIECHRTGKRTSHSLADLGLREDAISEAVVQFWACAQGRTMLVFNNVMKTKNRLVPAHLLPTAQFLARIRAAWAV